MGNKICIKDYTEKEEIETQKNEISLNHENAQIIENNENDKKLRIYSGEGILKPDKKTEIRTLNKEYIEFIPLSFSKRKELANKLFQEGTEESLKKALDYDNTSFNIILKNYDFQTNKNLFYSFDEGISKANF